MKKLVYLVLGADGLVGRAFLTRMSSEENRFRIFAFPHRLADITEKSYIVPLMDYIKPTVVVNCAAINDEDICQDAKHGAFLVNGAGAGIVADACKKNKAKLVHFSTCNVFDGKGSRPYIEEAKTSSINIHGQSKITGEEEIRKVLDDHLIIRLGWAFNYESSNLVTNWVRALEDEDKVSAIDDIISTVSYLPDVMDGIVELLALEAKGTFHIVNSGELTQNDLATLVCQLLGKSKTIPVKAAAQTWWKAPITKYSALSTGKYEAVTKVKLRSWQEAIKHCLFTMNKYKPE